MRLPQPVEQDDLVEPVEEFGPEVRPHHFHHLRLDLLDAFVLAQPGEILRPQVRRQNDDRIGKIDRATLPVGQPPVVEHLQQHVEHIAVGLLDLVEQYHLVGPPPHRLGQHPAFLITDIARRRADQPRHRMLFHIFGHVDPHHRG